MARLDPFDRPGEGVRRVGGEVSQYVDRARRLGLSFTQDVQLSRVGVADIAAIRSGTFALSSQGDRLAYVAPDENAMPAVHRWLARHPTARPRLRVSTPTAIRSALMDVGGDALVRAAVTCLADDYPGHSARTGASAT